MRNGRRNTPALSVTVTKVLPESEFVAVTVTPGRTPPVESVIVPVTVASCAKDAAGTARMSASASTQRDSRCVTGASLSPGCRWEVPCISPARQGVNAFFPGCMTVGVAASRSSSVGSPLPSAATIHTSLTAAERPVESGCV